mmetsp:Transcript_25689/g.81507  ORF Transcript_25689/g.81507 Transcript_25689/m.81507 type:complete len:160 (-) Transcript_25689:566-1045(-)
MALLCSSELLSSCDWFDDEQQSDEVVVFNAAAPANKTTAAESAAKAARRGVSKKRSALREGEAAPQWRKPLKQPKEVRGAGLYRSSQPEEEEEEEAGAASSRCLPSCRPAVKELSPASSGMAAPGAGTRATMAARSSEPTAATCPELRRTTCSMRWVKM